ncbi:hypothetical protein N0V83_004265 [Neocucurbitaria cava]|uniref:Uncharacterized protein n=1 Tax=Neocucurbitaria cava TaxID=798079 RepID=A0A9W8YAH1_9PLEO|nr:hypothetical protein N0V83_004265 [Neocucurbitaria cava]
MGIPEQALRGFIAWNLEREHGDLGLGSSARKPPLSPLGKSLISEKASKPIQVQVNDIYDSAGGHIGLAKARLDLIHTMESLDGIETRRDQLPANIITIFDSGLKRIERQPLAQCDMALNAIAAALTHIKGVGVPELRERLHNRGAAETRSGEDILEATRGFLEGSPIGRPQKLAAYHHSFFTYIAERYHVGIHRASQQINRPRVPFENQNISESPAEVTPHKLARSATLQIIEEEPVEPFIIRKGTRPWK